MWTVSSGGLSRPLLCVCLAATSHRNRWFTSLAARPTVFVVHTRPFHTGVGICWSALGGSGFSLHSLLFITVALLTPFRSGARLVPFGCCVQSFRGGSRFSIPGFTPPVTLRAAAAPSGSASVRSALSTAGAFSSSTPHGGNIVLM